MRNITFFTIILTFNIIIANQQKAISPQAIAYSINGEFLVTANQSSNNISIFKVNSLTGKIEQLKKSPIQTGKETVFAIFSPKISDKLQLLAVTNQKSNDVSIFKVDPLKDNFLLLKNSKANTETTPVSLAFTSNKDHLLIAATANQDSDSISIFNVNRQSGEFKELNRSFKVGKFPQSITFCPAHSNHIQIAVIANQKSDNISLFKVNTLTGEFNKLNEVKTGDGPVAVACSPEYADTGITLIGVANQFSNNISMFRLNISSGQITEVNRSPYQVGQNPVALAFSPEYSSGFRFLAVTNQSANTISIFKINTLTGEINPIPRSIHSTGNGPGSIAFSPEYKNGMKYAAVANQFSNNISIFRIDSVGQEFKEIADSPFALS